MRRRIRWTFRKKIIVAAIILLLAMTAIWHRQQLRRTVAKACRYVFDNPSRYEAAIAAAAGRHAVDSRLIYAVISKESGFDHDIVGGVGEIGLMQIRPTTAATDWARVHGVPVPVPGVLFDSALNIEIGTWYLGEAIQRWRNYKYGIELALCHYNAGESKAREWAPDTYDGELKPITYPTTRQYVKEIMTHYRKLKGE